MKAILVEGVAGSGKTTYLAENVKNNWISGKALLLTFSRTGKEVFEYYLQQRHIDINTVYTFDGLALSLLKKIGDNRFFLNRDRVEKEILPSLYLQACDQLQLDMQRTQDPFDLPSFSPRLMTELMSDMDFYRFSCAHDYEDEEQLCDFLAGKLRHDWRLIRRLFSLYERYRETWHPSLSQHDATLFDHDEDASSQGGELGFRTIGEAVYDLLHEVHGSDFLEKYGKQFSQQFVDEFHDTTPLHFRFFAKLATHARYVVVVGDRFQNIYAWRGTNTTVLFDQFSSHFNAEIRYLNDTYRYGKNIASIASTLIDRQITPQTPYDSQVTLIAPEKLTGLDRETVVIAKNAEQQIQAAFDFFTNTKHKLAFNISHSIGVAILNILCVLRYDYLLHKESKVVKSIGFDWAQFLQLPQCLLDYSAKQEMLKKPTLESIRLFFNIHLQDPSQPTAERLAYHWRLNNALVEWLNQSNQENQLVYDIMVWFEKTTFLWTTQHIYDRINRSAWEALKADALRHQYTLKQWPERAEQLHQRYSLRSGIRFSTVAQAKGKEFDEVCVYASTTNGFHQYREEQDKHLFYIAMTRAKKALFFYATTPLVLPQEHPSPRKKTSPLSASKKLEFKNILSDLKKELKKALKP